MSEQPPETAPITGTPITGTPITGTPITDNAASHRFELVEDGHPAELVYRRDGDRLHLVHTEVPPELEGRGLGGALVRAAVADAQAHDLTLVPSCPFALEWLQRHPDVAEQIHVEWPASA